MIRILPSNGMLMSYITNKTFSVIISNQERVDYQIVSKDNDTGIIVFSLSIEDSSKISQGEDPDYLEVTLDQKIIINTTSQIVIFSNNLSSKKSIPPLLQESKDLIIQLYRFKINRSRPQRRETEYPTKIGKQHFYVSFISP